MTIALPPSRSPLSILPPPNPPPPYFTVARRTEAGSSIRLVLAGELDLAARHHFATALDEAQHDSDRVLLDLEALTFIDCACLATLFAAARRGRRGRASLIVLGPRAQVRRMLDLVGSPAGVAVLDHGDLSEQQAPVAA